MTARTPDKTAARSLAALTGAPYQACLAAVPVLRLLPTGTDDALAAILGGRDPLRSLTLGLDEVEEVERALRRPFEPWLRSRSEVLLRNSETEEGTSRVSTALVPPDTALPAGTTLLVDDFLFSSLPRRGVWQTDLKTLMRACKAALQTDTGDWSVDLVARPADPSLVPPETAPTIEVSELLATVRPEVAGPGPGFTWLRVRLDALGVDPVRATSRRSAYRGYSSAGDTDSAAGDVTPNAIVVPDVLL